MLLILLQNLLPPTFPSSSPLLLSISITTTCNWSSLARNQAYGISCWHRLWSFLFSNVSSNETHPAQTRNLI
ncbi:hypothetical protein Forpe1208_v007838 [Fusarium oxysporum f. sp. rapae]|uniref:Uncharacterized protein n=1 Tax=Fusarium oxysporum f. sp. rapae TaxID=485398 RepID=A0A8J5P549_FUSOX|nr:hypothetical protein Forpe1208_v007838 [Fusarium oxysporum f. sp. rapae]